MTVTVITYSQYFFFDSLYVKYIDTEIIYLSVV